MAVAVCSMLALNIPSLNPPSCDAATSSASPAAAAAGAAAVAADLLFRRRCGRGEPSPGADVAAASAVPVQMWAGTSTVPVQMWARANPGLDVAGAR